MNPKIFIKLFPNCVIVKGASRSTIYDLQRGKFKLIPNSLGSLFDETGCFHKSTVEDALDTEYQSSFQEYLDFLEQNEFVFECSEDDIGLYPPLSLKWDFPAQANSLIIDFDKSSQYNYRQVLLDCTEKIKCSYLQFRHYGETDLGFWMEIMNTVNSCPIKTIDIIMKDSPNNFNHEELTRWVLGNRKIRCITLHSSLINSVISSGDSGFGVVLSTKEQVGSDAHCGVIHSSYFSVNILHYTESLAHNTCLNRKISIDVDGEIKNCPSMKESFGNIKDTTLEEAINKPGFKKYWNITKDQITKCKDCEFRHVCTDCRAYLENPDDIYSAPLKCGYDPYTCEWEEWSTNPLKQQAIEHYDMREILIATQSLHKYIDDNK